MVDSVTANYSFILTEVGGSDDLWGPKINTNWASIDTQLKAVADAAADHSNLAELDANNVFTHSGSVQLAVQAQSSGAGNDDDAILRLTATEAGQATVIFSRDSTVEAVIDVDNTSGAMRITSRAGGIRFYENNTYAAVLGPAGVALAADETVVTREKGDARYAPVGGAGLGVGQTWQDVKSTRATGGVVYQNTTGKPIQVAVFAGAATMRTFQVSADNVSWVTVGELGGNYPREVSVVIPDQHHYKFTGTAIAFSYWAELR